MLQQVISDPLRLGFGLVTFINRDNDRTSGCLGMINSLDGLGHHRIICSHHQHNNIGCICPAQAHFGKGFMAGCIDKGDEIPRFGFNLICANMLGNPA